MWPTIVAVNSSHNITSKKINSLICIFYKLGNFIFIINSGIWFDLTKELLSGSSLLPMLHAVQRVEIVGCSQLLSHLWLDVQVFPYVSLKEKLLLMFKEHPVFRHS